MRPRLTRELKTAIAANALDVHYQPVVAHGPVRSELKRCCAEPRGPRRYRGWFCPIAEQNGLMPQVGEFVLRRALADAARWPNLFVAVNLSPVQIRDRALVDLVATVMAENHIEFLARRSRSH